MLAVQRFSSSSGGFNFFSSITFTLSESMRGGRMGRRRPALLCWSKEIRE